MSPSPTPRRVVIVAPDFGEHRSAATSRYRSLVDAANVVGLRVAVVNEVGLTTPEMADLPMTKPTANQLSLLRRVCSEIATGFRMAFKVPRQHLAIVGMPPAFTAFVVCSILRIRRINYWLDVRDVYPDVLVSAGLIRAGSLTESVLSWWARRVYAGAERLTAATADLVERIANRTSQPVDLVKNGFGRRFEVAPMPDLEHPTIATHGTLGRFQDSPLLAQVILEARKRQLPWRFLIVGDGPTSSFVEKAIGPTLTWHRSATQEEMPLLLAPAAIGVSLRTKDDISAGSIPVRMLEYIGLGIPVLVYPPSEGGNAIEERKIGMVATEATAESIIDQLATMLEPNRYLAMRRQAMASRRDFSGPAQWESQLSRVALTPVQKN